jgi:isopenicillin-N epimerase
MSLRDQFLLRDDVVFLNHGSYGACPRPVFAAYQAWQRELESQPVEFMGRRFGGLMATARTALAGFLGADADEVAFQANVTVALNVVARALPLRDGDEILTIDHEYGALDRTWRFMGEHTGSRYVVRPIPLPVDDAATFVEQVWAGVTDRTRVLFLSHITSPTALILPIGELIARARERGIWTVIDGAHAPGQIDVDLHALGADFYGGNCHKWLMAPKGAGFLYARRDVQHLVEPLVVSWGWQARDPGPSRFVDEQQAQGTRDPAAYLAVPAAIAFQRANDWAAVRAGCHQSVERAIEQMASLTGLPPIAADPARWHGQLATMPLPECDVAVVKRQLYDRHRVEIPILRWNDRPYARISVQGYNTAADVDALVAGLRDVLHLGGG